MRSFVAGRQQGGCRWQRSRQPVAPPPAASGMVGAACMRQLSAHLPAGACLPLPTAPCRCCHPSECLCVDRASTTASSSCRLPLKPHRPIFLPPQPHPSPSPPLTATCCGVLPHVLLWCRVSTSPLFFRSSQRWSLSRCDCPRPQTLNTRPWVCPWVCPQTLNTRPWVCPWDRPYPSRCLAHQRRRDTRCSTHPPLPSRRAHQTGPSTLGSPTAALASQVGRVLGRVLGGVGRFCRRSADAMVPLLNPKPCAQPTRCCLRWRPPLLLC